jgi:hypothetical protein
LAVLSVEAAVVRGRAGDGGHGSGGFVRGHRGLVLAGASCCWPSRWCGSQAGGGMREMRSVLAGEMREMLAGEMRSVLAGEMRSQDGGGRGRPAAGGVGRRQVAGRRRGQPAGEEEVGGYAEVSSPSPGRRLMPERVRARFGGGRK